MRLLRRFLAVVLRLKLGVCLALLVLTIGLPANFVDDSALAQSTITATVDFSGQEAIPVEVQTGVIQTLTAEAYLFTDRTNSVYLPLILRP